MPRVTSILCHVSSQ